MAIDYNKVKNILRSAAFSAIASLCNNLIYIVILHYLSLNKDNASLQQNGLSMGLAIVQITFDAILVAFSQGLKILYAQFCSSMETSKSNGNKNILLYQSIFFGSSLGLFLLIVVYCSFDLFFYNLLGYDQSVIELTKIGFIYVLISRIILVAYDFTRSQLVGLKVFGPFAFIQSAVFGVICLLTEVIYQTSQIGIHQAGLLLILHDILKIVCLVFFLKFQNKNNQSESIKEINYTTFVSTVKIMFEERGKLKDLILFVRPLVFLTYFEIFFFNVSVIISGRYSSEYILTCVCYQLTNSFIFKGITGICESVVSFCGTAFASRDYAGVKEYLKYSIFILIVYEGFFISVLTIFSDQWARSITLSEEAIKIIHEYKYHFFVTIPLDGLQLVFVAFLQVIEMKNFVAKVSTINYIIIGIPLMFILSDVCGLKIGGLWLAIGFANTLNLIQYYKKSQNLNYDDQFELAQTHKDLAEQNQSKKNSLQIELIPRRSSIRNI